MGKIIVFVMGLFAGIVAAVLLLNDTETYEGELVSDDLDLGATEVRLDH